jgi:hypothetical protein
MKRYDNGELVTKDRMEDEEWYGQYYQPFLEYIMDLPNDVDEIYEKSIKMFKNDFDEDLSKENKEKILRWCTFQVERMGGQGQPKPKYDECDCNKCK